MINCQVSTKLEPSNKIKMDTFKVKKARTKKPETQSVSVIKIILITFNFTIRKYGELSFIIIVKC